MGLYVTGTITACAGTTRLEMALFRVGIDTDPQQIKVARPIIGANNALNLGNRRWHTARKENLIFTIHRRQVRFHWKGHFSKNQNDFMKTLFLQKNKYQRMYTFCVIYYS